MNICCSYSYLYVIKLKDKLSDMYQNLSVVPLLHFHFSTYDKKFNCARNVSTILCVHEAECSPFDCSGHGICRNGKCICNKFWTGPHCDHLNCPHDCSQHGICTKGGILSLYNIITSIFNMICQ